MGADAPDVRHATLQSGQEICWWHAGVGGTPLLLVHGWPETRLIWERNIRELAAAGFEVIAPDLRAFGGSGIPADGFHDPAAHSLDLQALICELLGHRKIRAAGGDLGGVVLQDLGLRFEGLIERQIIFNSPLPLLNDAYEEAGLPRQPTEAVKANMGYFVRQGSEADELAGELASEAARVAYVESFYLERGWAAPGSFLPDDAARMAQPFADPERFRATLGNYESALGNRPLSTLPRFFETIPTPTLALYGASDTVIPREFPRMCEVVFEELAPVRIVEGVGHFLQWEASGVFNEAAVEWLLPGRNLPGARLR